MPEIATWKLPQSEAARRMMRTCLVLSLWASPPATAQTWTGELTAAWITQDAEGSDAGHRTQLGLDEGFLLEGLELGFQGEGDDVRRFRLTAWGFGDAEPAAGVELGWRPGKDWRLEAEYRRTDSIFELVDRELGRRTDDGTITRIGGTLTWDGWSGARLSLRLSQVERTGVVTQPFREFGEIYLLGTDLDETRRRAALQIESRGLPVHLAFEQSFARLERRNRYFPAQIRNLDGDDPELFVDAGSERREDRDIPTSRLVATYNSGRIEATGALLLSEADLDVRGESFATFGLGEDTLGRSQFVRDPLGSASLDALVGHLDVGFRLAPRWILRLRGRHHDRAQDAAIAGRRLLRLTNALGDEVEIPQAIDDSTFLDVVDTTAHLEVEHRAETWSAWAGVFDTRREVDHDPGGERDAFRVRRESDGYVLGLAVHLGRRVKASVEAERGSFERFVFRTDPETVRRSSVKLRADLGKGWSARLRGRFEDAENPAEESALDRRSDSYGAGILWADGDGKHEAGLDFDRVEVSTETVLLLPGGGSDLSLYDLSYQTLGAHGRVEFGPVQIAGALQWLEDDGRTWPLEAWNARLRLSCRVHKALEVALFGQLWSYEEELADTSDFDLDRLGLALTWRFE